MLKNELEPGDFRVAVRRREHALTPWRWEIWAAVYTKAVGQSECHLPLDRRVIIVDAQNHFLYLIEGNGRAIRYGVGRQGFSWSGVATVRDKQEWPDWYPPREMFERKPEPKRRLKRWSGKAQKSDAVLYEAVAFGVTLGTPRSEFTPSISGPLANAGLPDYLLLAPVTPPNSAPLMDKRN